MFRGLLFLAVEGADLLFVPFHTGLAVYLETQAGAGVARHEAVNHRHPQLCRRTGRSLSPRLGFKRGLGLAFGTRAQTLDQRMDGGVFDRHPDFARQLRGALIRSSHAGEISQFVFQRGGELLMGAQRPALPDGNAPRAVSRIFSAPHVEHDHAEGRAQLHPFPAPMPDLLGVVGEKSRRVARLGPGAFLRGGDASTRALGPRLPIPCRATNRRRLYPSSSVTFQLFVFLCLGEEPTSWPQYGACVKLRPALLGLSETHLQNRVLTFPPIAC